MGVDRGGSIRELKEMLEQHASCLTAAEGRVSVAAIAKTRGGSIALPAIPPRGEPCSASVAGNDTSLSPPDRWWR